jgi:molybdopterin molybdotransferase
VAALTFSEARALVLRELGALLAPPSESVPLASAHGKFLAAEIKADRDYPPFHRAMRDGFAVRAAEMPGEFRVIGEVRAGTAFDGVMGPGEAVAIMTGAPVPAGADAVVMVEHCERPNATRMQTGQSLPPGANISSRGCEAREGDVVIEAGERIDYSLMAELASTGHAAVAVYQRPRVAILATGDEIVEVAETPLPHQIRNSNSWSLAAQVERAGGIPVVMPVARDVLDETRLLLEKALASADLLLLSGGVSAGSYDVVEPALAQLGAQFFFDRVRIQPGAPVVFGRVRNRFFFGLPGNPASTMITFEVFARAAVERLAGSRKTDLPIAFGRLTRPFHHKGELTRFLPAHITGGAVTPVVSQGSGDVAALCRANCYLIAKPEKLHYEEGDFISVLTK